MTAVEKGTMTLGFEGKNGVRTSSLAECQEIIDVFFDHGHSELDTARMYAEGMTEQVQSSQYSIQRGPMLIHNPCVVSLGSLSAQSQRCDDRHQVSLLIWCAYEIVEIGIKGVSGQPRWPLTRKPEEYIHDIAPVPQTRQSSCFIPTRTWPQCSVRRHRT